jgi:hypothetical protein
MLRGLMRRGARRGQPGLVLAVDFESDGGRRWAAIGGGPTVEDAIAFARESLPGGCGWRVVGWDHLYGD